MIMKAIVKLCFSLLLGSFFIGNLLFGQIFKAEVVVPYTVYGNSPYQAIVEEPQSGNLIVTTGIDECGTCPNQNVNIQVFDPLGNVLAPSFQVGLPNVSEIPYAIELTSNPSEVIIVGEQVDTTNTRAFAMRVDWVSGTVIWHHSYDAFFPAPTRDRFQGIQQIIDPATGASSYLFYGISQNVFPAGSYPKIYVALVDPAGNLLYSTRYFQNPVSGLDLGFDPTDMKVNDKGNLIMTGTCYETTFTGIAERDIFLLEMDVYGQLVSPLSLYDVNDGAGTTIWNERPSIIATNNPNYPNSIYVLAFDSKDIWLGFPGYYTLTSLVVSQGTHVPFGNPELYYDTDYENNRVSGLGEDPTGTGNYLVGTIHSVSYAGVFGEPAGLLTLDQNLNAVDLLQYQPGLIQLGGYCMIVCQRGIYHKAILPNTDTYQVIHSDYDGQGNYLGDMGCYVQLPPSQQQGVVINRKVKMAADNEPAWTAHSPGFSLVTGNIIFCDGTGGSFKKPQPEVVDGHQDLSDFQVFPSVVLRNEGVNLEIKATTPGTRMLRVTNLNGQVLYTATLRVEAGKNAFVLPASDFGSGMNLIQLTDPDNQALTTRRVIRQ